MKDRELLEAAAKAAGHGVEFDDASGMTFMDTKHTGLLWNPLHNDGDALRLAVYLQLDVYVRGGWIEAVGPMGAPQKVHYNGADARRDAARLAIVRAAAAMVKP